MTKPLINILVRTHNRKESFKLMYDSIVNQTYKNYNIIVCYDGDKSYIPEHLQSFKVKPLNKRRHFYNLYCNELKEKVTDGWFMFLDDDDFFIDNTALERIANNLEGNTSYIFRMKRDKLFPDDKHFEREVIRRGEIGMPCIVQHHSTKDLIQFTDNRAADYRYIKELSKKIELKWIDEVIVLVPKQSRGR